MFEERCCSKEPFRYNRTVTLEEKILNNERFARHLVVMDLRPRGLDVCSVFRPCPRHDEDESSLLHYWCDIGEGCRHRRHLLPSDSRVPQNGVGRDPREICRPLQKKMTSVRKKGALGALVGP